MSSIHRLQMGSLFVSLGALLAPVTSVAQDFSDSDTREIGSYVLTEAGLAKYTQATQNLAELASRMSDVCGEDEDAEDVSSLADMVDRLGAKPGVAAAIKSAGMTTREFIVFGLSLFQNGMAAWALSQPGGELPPGTSMANVNFYRANEKEIQAMRDQATSGDCD